VSLSLKLAVLFAMALALFNGQCVANCMAFPCQSQDDSSMPPCHRHHQQAPKVCAQPAMIGDSAPAAQSPVFLVAAGPIASIAPAAENRLQGLEWISPPEAPPRIQLPLRI
jgi:hypothetical protein